MEPARRPPDCFFIETFDGEAVDAWEADIEAALAELTGRPGYAKEMHYSPGPVVSWSGRRFRSFRCWAGSVFFLLYQHATGPPFHRGMFYVGSRAGKVEGEIVPGCGIATFDATDIVKQVNQSSAGTARPTLTRAANP